MRIEIPKLQSVTRSLGHQVWGFSIVGWLTTLGAAFWLFIGTFSLLAPEQPEDVPLGVAVIVLGGGVSAALAATFFVLARAARAKARRVETLAALVRKGASLDGVSLARALSLSPPAAERLLVEALSRGIVVEDDGGAGGGSPAAYARAPFAPTPSLQQGWTGPDHPVAEPEGSPGALPRPSASSLVGVVLNGTYEVESLLGVGGMSEVYVARHLRTGKRNAVKALLPGSRFSDEAIRRFRREASAASALGHPGIVEIRDFDVTPDGTHFIVTELLEGETLEARLERRGHLPWKEAAPIASELVSALGAAHEAGILHRDLKPSNVFLAKGGDGRERAVLLDFGIAKQLDDPSASRITTTGTVIGTPLYMSPEQARSEDLDVRTDVYALGCLLFEMLTGRPPFVASSMASLYAKLLNEPAPSPSSVAPQPLPEALDDLVSCALAKDRGERFASVAALGAALREIDRLETARSGVRLAGA